MHTPILPGIDAVGVIDWNVRDFHSYHTHRGATYNAYLLRDQKTVLIDTVKAPFVETLLQNIRELMDPASIDAILCQHGEPDHAGGLPAVMAACPRAELLCSAKGKESILAYHPEAKDWRIRVIATGDTLSLGRFTLRFFETPMVHWPDSMATYLPEEKILFSMDAFGQHIATSGRFDDENDLSLILEEAKAYYANIVMPYGRQVVKVLEAIKNLSITMIAPAHGVIWRRHAATILQAYRDWVVCKPLPKVLVLYDSMWESTAVMARAIVEGASQPGISVVLIAIRSSDLTRIATEALDAACIVVGSSTLNQTLMPAAAAAMTYLYGLRPIGKVGFAFGSYGWGAKGGAEAVEEYLRAMKVEILRDPITCRWRPDEATLALCREAGQAVAEKARAIASAS